MKFKNTLLLIPFGFWVSLTLDGANVSNTPTEGFRAEPLRNLTTELTINARDFGAIPDDEGPDTAAIRSAIEFAKNSGKACKILFEKGRYLIDNDAIESAEGGATEKYMALWIAEAKDLVIDGNGARLIVTNPRSGLFRITRSSRVIIRNFTIDFDPLPFSAGYIRAIHRELKAIDLEVVAPHPAMTASYFSRKTGGYGYPIDAKIPGRIKDNAPNVFLSKNVTDLGKGVFRIFMRDSVPVADLDYLSVGDRYVQIARQPGADLFRAVQSQDVTLDHITSYASAAAHYVAVNSDRLNLIQCSAQISTGRWMGGNADGVHVQNCRVGPWVEGCHFEGIGDDGFNIYTRPFFVSKVTGEKSVLLSSLRKGEAQVGDVVQFFDPPLGKIVAQLKITKIEEGKNEVTFDGSVPALRTGSGPDAIQLYNSELSRGFVIKDSRFVNLRRFGTLIKARDGLVENNRYEGTSSSAIIALNEPSYPEGLFCNRITIRNNQIDHCGFDRDFNATLDWGLISFQAMSANGPMERSGLLKEIEISGNMISDWSKRAIIAANIDGLTIARNHFGKPRSEKSVGITIHQCEGVKVSENIFPDDMPEPLRMNGVAQGK